MKWNRFDDAKGDPMTLDKEMDFGKTHLYGITFHQGKFVAASGYGKILYSATGEGGSWKKAPSAKIKSDPYYSVAYGNCFFMPTIITPT